MTDLQEIFRKIKSEDSERAFKALFESQYERVFRLAFYFLQNDEWAKDVAITVFSDIWEKRKTMVIPTDFRSFSFVMVKNLSINVLRRENRLWEDGGGETDLDSSVAQDPQTLLEQAELFEKYESLVASLPDRCREVYCRVKEDGMSYAEVAHELGISVKTVDAQLQKALQILRHSLSAYHHL